MDVPIPDLSVPVNLRYSITVGASLHKAAPPPPAPPTPSPQVSVEFPAFQGWPPGKLTKHSFTNTVKHLRQDIVQDGHDCGRLIFDLTPAIPANIFYALYWPVSSRKPIYSASKVKMDGTATACATSVAFPPLPEMTCGFPASTMSALNTPLQLYVSLNVGMTLMDLLMGIVQVKIEQAIDLLFFSIQGMPGEKAVTDLLKKPAKEIGKGIIESEGKGLLKKGGDYLTSPGGPAREALSSATGGGQNLYTENATKPTDGAPTANEGVSHTSEGFKARGSGNSPATGESSSPFEDSSLGEALP